MFPLKTQRPYPRNLWWVAAYSGELKDDILGRTILGERIVMFRDESASPVALFGYCPHRSYPFELGALVEGRIRCGYHGFEFGHGGRCLHVPTQKSVPKNSSARAYPVVERDGLIWIWTGQPELADISLIPDAGSIGMGKDWTCVPQAPVTIKGRYTLLVDNLLDLSHGSYLHAATLPGSGAIALTEPVIKDTAHSLCIHRLGRNLPMNPLTKLLFPDADGGIDQCFDAEIISPALIRTAGEFFAAETGEEIGAMNILHAVTPETPNSFHYWVMQSRNIQRDNPAIDEFMRRMGERIQPEDIMAIEAIERALTDQGDEVAEMSARVDTGALLARRRLERLIAAEGA